MHSAHFYVSNQPLKLSKKKNNKKKAKKTSNIVDINIGNFTKEVDSKGAAIPHEIPVKLAKVNIEFDEANAVRVDDENDDEENNNNNNADNFEEQKI